MKHRSLKVALVGLAAGGIGALCMAGCSRDSEAAPAVKEHQEQTVEQTVAAPAASTTYKLQTGTEGDCKAGATCVLAIKLEALGDFHINKEYPYKFKAEAAGVEFEGTDAAGKNVFSKGAGDFKIDGEKTATMRVRFKPSTKGNVTVGGTYKMSVCSPKECQLESQEVSAVVAVK